MDGFFVKLKPHKTFMLRALERLFFTKITNKCLGSAGFSVDTAKPETSVSEELRLVMGNIKYAGRARESAWRRMAGTAWDAPKDPSIYGFLDVEAGPIERRIAQLRAQGVHVTVTHVVAHAVAKALGNHPDLNVMLRWGRPWRRENVDVFVQVALPGDDGVGSAELSGVKIEEADKESLQSLAETSLQKVRELRSGKNDLLAKSRKRLSMVPQFMRRLALRFVAFLTYTCNISPRIFGLPKDPFGSAAVTSVGMMGIDTGFAPLFPVGGPPIIVTVGAIQARPVVDSDGRVIAKSMLRLGGTFDHRVLDGYHIAAFSKDLIDVLEEEPERVENYGYTANAQFPY